MERIVRFATLLMLLFAPAGCDEAPPEAWRLVPAPGSPVACLPKVNAVSVADFNRDGRPDIAAINGKPGDLQILLQEQDGRFASTANVGRTAIGATASGLVAADVNADGLPDLIASFHDRDEVGVLLAKDGGEFAPPTMQRVAVRTSGSPHVHNLAVGDVNGDHHLDVLVAQSDDNAIAWALGNGAGGFAPAAQTFAAGQHPYTIVTADFNNDGHLDFASPNSQSADLTVGLGDGAGGFTAWPGTRPHIPQQTLALAVGDIDGNGTIDLVGNSDADQSELSVLLGDGRGGFTLSEHSFKAPARCYGQIVADLNGDGMHDIAAPCIDRASVIVWLAEDTRTMRFRRVEIDTPGTDSQVLAVTDLDGDGVLDAVAAGWSKPTITILLGKARDTEQER